MKAEGRGQKAEVRSLRRIALLLSSAFCLLPSAFISAQPWTAHPADGVEMHLSREGEINRLDFDFHGHGGYAIARRDVELELPANYQFTFRIRGDAPIETLEFKLIRGDDVWWMNRRDFAFPREWYGRDEEEAGLVRVGTVRRRRSEAHQRAGSRRDRG